MREFGIEPPNYYGKMAKSKERKRKKRERETDRQTDR